MFGSGKRWSVVEYTHRKCLTIDISMMFCCQFFFNFSFRFLFSPLLLFSCLMFFFCWEFSRLHFGAALSLSVNIPGCWVFCDQQEGNCTLARKFFLFYYFPFVSYKSSWKNPWPPGLATAVLVGKAFGNAHRTLGLDGRRGRWVVEEDFHANIRVFMLHGCKKGYI